MDELEKILGEALAEECRRLHEGKTLEIKISEHLDVHGIRGIESAVRGLYRSMFGGELKIEMMERDEDRVLHIKLGKTEKAD